MGVAEVLSDIALLFPFKAHIIDTTIESNRPPQTIFRLHAYPFAGLFSR